MHILYRQRPSVDDVPTLWGRVEHDKDENSNYNAHVFMLRCFYYNCLRGRGSRRCRHTLRSSRGNWAERRSHRWARKPTVDDRERLADR